MPEGLKQRQMIVATPLSGEAQEVKAEKGGDYAKSIAGTSVQESGGAWTDVVVRRRLMQTDACAWRVELENSAVEESLRAPPGGGGFLRVGNVGLAARGSAWRNTLTRLLPWSPKRGQKGRR